MGESPHGTGFDAGMCWAVLRLERRVTSLEWSKQGKVVGGEDGELPGDEEYCGHRLCRAL